MMIESDSSEKIEGLPEGSRFYVIQFYDGAGENAAASVLAPADLARVDESCERCGLPFHVGLEVAAWRHLTMAMWDGEEPPTAEPRSVTEVSRRELLSLMRLSQERIEAGRSTAS